ncbi:MAG: ABC transporter permease [Alphaproteobacteria bacterium]|nr:ABC transporter permease [Alphaproteobacteria bacterium]MBU0796351.1 ABC transporter permease [Alphaproteobacteria bacterium]MBU0887760.1 ABC transporter permease [Alphaproteobacteria bacterium]MBU1815017.1 ABC transporter permease [Alphaproteobacteria bacterium]
MTVDTQTADAAVPVSKPGNAIWRQASRNPGVIIGGSVLLLMTLIAIFAPFLGTVDPVNIDPISRLKKPLTDWFLGTDAFGRDIYSRIIYGARISLIVGAGAAVLSIGIGLFIGLISGYFRMVDAIVMRVMDGLMAIPGILLAIALVSLSGASLLTVMVAITIPEIPRVVRLVRSVVLSIREEPYVEAAISIGTPLPLILIRHVMPNTFAPLIVQGTYICASAMLTEAILSFLGAGIPPEIPTWGNIMAEGRVYFQIAPWIILFPGIFLSLTVLGVNVLGDGLRDTLDPRLAKRV